MRLESGFKNPHPIQMLLACLFFVGSSLVFSSGKFTHPAASRGNHPLLRTAQRTDQLNARIDLERSTNYTPNRFLLYIRFTPDGPAARPVSLPPDPVLFGPP